MVESAERAWQTGAISVTSFGAFIVILDRLDDEVRRSMLKKLIVPGNQADWPDKDELAWHFANVFGRS